jgi:hypothetical protein
MPLLGAAQGGLLFPLNWFYLFLSPALATNLMVLSTFMLAGLGAFVARRTGSSVTGAALTSLIWQAGGFLINQISHINIVQTAALLPWVLWAIERYVVNGSRSRWSDSVIDRTTDLRWTSTSLCLLSSAHLCLRHRDGAR